MLQKFTSESYFFWNKIFIKTYENVNVFCQKTDMKFPTFLKLKSKH